MKRDCFIIVLVVLLALALISCDANSASSESNSDILEIESNIAEDGSVLSRGSGDSVSIPNIHGVLLKYHNEGLYSNDSYFAKDYNSSTGKFKKQNAFYLEYLTDDHETWYGMVYNYVLYVPDIIQTTYKEGGGKNPDSGNPFWWYMNTYYGKNMDSVRDDWESSIQLLQKHKVNGVRLPDKKDVTGSWSENYSSLSSTQNGAETKIKSNIASHYYDGEKTVWVDRIMYFDNPVRFEKDREAYYQIFVPEALRKAYAAGSGLHSYFDALVWYFEAFYNVSAQDLATAYGEDRFGELLDECYAEYGYTEPSAYDVECVLQFNTVRSTYSGGDLQLGSVYYYIPGTLKLDDGSIVQNCERIYLNVRDGNRVDFYVPEAYIEQMKDTYKEKGEDFRFNGSLIWNYFEWNSITREATGITLTQADIAKLLQYRASE